MKAEGEIQSDAAIIRVLLELRVQDMGKSLLRTGDTFKSTHSLSETHIFCNGA